jgi:hypothetical protein
MVMYWLFALAMNRFYQDTFIKFLADENFFEYNMQHAKGAKMPIMEIKTQ